MAGGLRGAGNPAGQWQGHPWRATSAIENLRGVTNRHDHTQIHVEWNKFFRENPTTTKEALLKKVREIDEEYGSRFDPPWHCNDNVCQVHIGAAA